MHLLSNSGSAVTQWWIVGQEVDCGAGVECDCGAGGCWFGTCRCHVVSLSKTYLVL